MIIAAIMPSAKLNLIGSLLFTLLCLQVTQSRMIPFKDRGSVQRTVELPGWTVVSEQGSIDLGGHSTSDACLQACLNSATGCQFVQYTLLNGDCDGFAFANDTAVAMPSPDLKNNPSTFSLLTVTKKQDAYIEYNVNYPFEDFLHIPNNTPQSCLTYCQFHPECVRSSYKHSTKECWFKKVLRYNRTINRDHVTFTFF